MDLAAIVAYLDKHSWATALLGWSAVTFIWENFVKRGVARRGLAHMLAEEMALNLQTAAAQRIFHESNPKSVPQDLHFSQVAFAAVTARLGELPRWSVGDVIHYYERIGHLNQIPRDFATALTAYRELQKKTTGGLETKALYGSERDKAKASLDRLLTLYEDSLNRLIQHSNRLLPRLRVASTFAGRVGYLFVPKHKISVEKIRQEVAELEAERQALSDNR